MLHQDFQDSREALLKMVSEISISLKFSEMNFFGEFGWNFTNISVKFSDKNELTELWQLPPSQMHIRLVFL